MGGFLRELSSLYHRKLAYACVCQNFQQHEVLVVKSRPLSLWTYTMNRCISQSSRRTSCAAMVLVTAFTLASIPAWAQSSAAADPAVRPFPAQALRGTLVVTHPPEILIDGKPERLSPGARIRGANNMLVMSGALVGKTAVVNFVREPLGLVHEVWILTEAEARLAHTLATPRPY
jgi:hypothetical protein